MTPEGKRETPLFSLYFEPWMTSLILTFVSFINDMHLAIYRELIRLGPPYSKLAEFGVPVTLYIAAKMCCFTLLTGFILAFDNPLSQGGLSIRSQLGAAPYGPHLVLPSMGHMTKLWSSNNMFIFTSISHTNLISSRLQLQKTSGFVDNFEVYFND